METTSGLSPTNPQAIYTRNSYTCPNEQPKPHYKDHTIIAVDINQPLINALEHCSNHTSGDDYKVGFYGDSSEDGTTSYCWFYQEIRSSCAQSEELKCLKERVQNERVPGLFSCFHPKGNAGKKNAVSSVVVVAAVIGVVSHIMAWM
jgi:hypothetical protein